MNTMGPTLLNYSAVSI